MREENVSLLFTNHFSTFLLSCQFCGLVLIGGGGGGGGGWISSPNVWQLWRYELEGGTVGVEATDIAVVPSGGVVVSGNVYKSSVPGKDFYLVRLSDDGAMLWNQTDGIQRSVVKEKLPNNEFRSTCVVS